MPRGIWVPVVLLAAACGVAAAQTADQDAVTAGGRALRNAARFPWYDGDQDELRRVAVKPQADAFPGRHSRWQTKPWRPTRARPPMLQGLSFVAWVFLALLLAAVIGLLVWAFMQGLERRHQQTAAREPPAVMRSADRVEELPVPIDATSGSLIEQARRHFEAGRYREAIICLFSHQLIQLDNHHLIHLERGKTNRQYLREIRRQPALRTLLERTMVAFEDVFFGQHDISRDRFLSCWTQVDEFQREVESAV